MKKILFFLMPLLLVFSATAKTPRPTSDQTAAEKYIRESDAQWAESVASGDTKAIERILADHFIGTDPKGSLYDHQIPNTAVHQPRDRGRLVTDFENRTELRYAAPESPGNSFGVPLRNPRTWIVESLLGTVAGP